MPSVVSRVSEYAPGWLAEYATVASALRDNYSALGPFEMSDVMIGITYLREEERRKRAEDLKSMVGKPPDADVLGRGPTPAELDDLRALCHATEAAYLEDRDKLAAALNEIKHQVVVSEHTSKFQKPAHYVSQRVDTGDIFFVVRGTAILKDVLTDGDCAPKPLDSKLPEMAGAQAHEGHADLRRVARTGAPPDAPQRRRRYRRHEKNAEDHRPGTQPRRGCRRHRRHPPPRAFSNAQMRRLRHPAVPRRLGVLGVRKVSRFRRAPRRRHTPRVFPERRKPSRAAAEYRLEDDGGG